ncbi:RodZ domain-containing protein [Ferrimonas senticii]|uniref:RodZ domain-containing protein n=1 Tax=Ferrimonas senticii TaxID=394566 RepID=UPI0004874C42|nr:RodZ domain-containing protein [Ferrimonas senticii]
MTDQVDTESQSEVSETPGPLLRDAREQLGLSTQQVAQRLNLRHSVVLGIEQDNYEAGMSVTYVRGYIRNYARLVGLNEQRLNSALDSVYKPAIDPSMQSFSERTKRDRTNGRWQALTWLIAAALLIALGWWLVTTQLSNSEPTRELPEAASLVTPAPIASAPSVPVPAVGERATVAIPTSDDSQVAEPGEVIAATPVAEATPLVATDSVVATAESPVAAEVPAAASADETVAVVDSLTISLSADCWMLVQDADGQTLLEGLKPAGYSTILAGNSPYKIRLGAPEAVSLSYNGEAVDLSKFRAGKVARLTVPQ